MSWEALKWAGDLRVGSPTAKSLLVVLANYADDLGECFPSHHKLSKVTELGLRAVQLNLNKLEAMGLVTRIRTRNEDGTLGGTRYRLRLEMTQATINAHHKHDVPVEKNDAPQASDDVKPQAPRAGLLNHHREPPIETPVAPKGAADEVDIDFERSKAEDGYGDFLTRYDPSPTASLTLPLRHWAKLSPEDRRRAVAGIGPYKAACAKERRKTVDPSAYLSRRLFDNFRQKTVARAPIGDAEAQLRRAMSPGFSGGVLVEHGTDAWAAWEAVAEAAGLPLRAIVYKAAPFAGRPQAATGKYLPSHWPPTRDGPDRRQRAAGERE